MKNLLSKANPFALFALVTVALTAVAAGVDPTPESIVTSGATGLVTSVLNVANSTWPIWIPVVAVMIGIRLFRKIAKV